MLLRVILAVADDKPRKRLREALRRPGLDVETHKPAADLWAQAQSRSADLILVDAAAVPPAPPAGPCPAAWMLVAVSPSDSAADHAALLAAGCDAVLHAALERAQLTSALDALIARRRSAMIASLSVRRLARPSLDDFISQSACMQEFMDVVRRVVPVDTTLLILGETGVGKERLARAIHAEGPRAEGPFVAVNCAALPDALLESELFGHEEGSFTGATRSRRGAFELAHQGTIFLDEIGEMPLHLQVKLLRVLQDRTVRPVGAEQDLQVDVRIMAASNRDLEAEVAAGRFRQDLYYRLSVLALQVPPLRSRVDDIPLLAASYVEFHRPRVGRHVRTLSPDVVEALRRYPWPGNVRELINVIERAMLLAHGPQIELADLPAVIRHGVAPVTAISPPAELIPLPPHWLQTPLPQLRQSMVDQLERRYLQALLQETKGRIGETARRAGIEPRSLYEKMKRYGMDKSAYRPPRRRGRPEASPPDQA